MWLIAFWCGMHSACAAYHSTPDIDDFAHFAFPYYSGHQGKFTFLFGPSVAVLTTGILLISIRTSWFENMRRLRLNLISAFPLRAFLSGCIAISLLLVAEDHAARSVAAAARTHWHGVSLPNGIVDTSCRLFQW
jgi:hypothetical protein